MERKNRIERRWVSLKVNGDLKAYVLLDETLRCKALQFLVNALSEMYPLLSYENCAMPHIPAAGRALYCQSPVFVDDKMPRAGLCVTSRHIVFLVIAVDHRAESMLGFRRTLLKTYESHCAWRNVFENALPLLCSDSIGDIKQVLHPIEENFKLAAHVYNSSKVTKQLLRLSSSNDPSKPWYLRVSSFLRILEYSYVPNIYCEGISITIIDILFLFYIIELLKSRKLLLVEFPQIERWLKVMYHKQSSMFCGDPVGSFDRSPCSDSELIPQTDIELIRSEKENHWSNHYNPGEGRSNLISLIIDSTGPPPIVPHPYYDFITSFEWKNVPRWADPGRHVPEKRASRKRQQILSLASAVLDVISGRPNQVIVDLCSGGGHVGLLLAFLVPDDYSIVLVDNKSESLGQAMQRIEDRRLSNANSSIPDNIFCVQCSIDEFIGDFDIGVTLHACGGSTDIVLDMCFGKKAAFVVCPCCYGNVRKMTNFQYPRSEKFRSKEIVREEFLFMTKGADNTGVDEQAEICMGIVDHDRLSHAQELGYSTTLTKLVPPEASPKNSLLIGQFESVTIT